MTLRVGINGFGRIGRLTLRAWYLRHRGDFEVVAINGRTPVDMHTHLLRYDSDYGRFPAPIEDRAESFVVDGAHEVRVLQQEDPAQIPWGDLGVDVVVESTGIFRDGRKAAVHLGDSVKKVLITAPANNEDWTVILGVNEEEYDRARHHVISAGSCTTNCVVPMVKVLHDAFGIQRGFMSTIHSYTRDQNLVDSKHKDLRRARAAAHNIIPTSTGAASAIGKLLPELAGKINGMAFRVPTSTVSLVDLVTDLEQGASEGAITEAFLTAAEGPMKGYLYYERDQLVSSDFREHPGSAIFDAPSTMIVDGGMAKTIGWYDNEWGYACRIADLCALFAERGIA
ncbi:MAG: type I glyceraldehyde-3-phosphate dehydrogenase [Chloroflexi bacterium]|nr:type I glyceraldehyde-3-phosphate dehydrogenase [Chloroflexota bacterium]